MILRHQLAVAPTITPALLARGAAGVVAARGREAALTAMELRRAFDAPACLLTDSGTSALILAFRVLVGRGGIVALPGYGCVDFASAVHRAGVSVRLYDVDPHTLSPDLESLDRALRRGVHLVVVAHYYGYPADVPGVHAIAASHGVPVLEDAAQGAGGTLDGRPLGALADLAILSFGRGKGLFGGGGGALLGHSADAARRIQAIRVPRASRGVRNLAVAVAQYAFGRPALYALPASLPWLHLGEMVYHPASEPAGIPAAAASLARESLRREPRDVAARRALAARLRATIDAASNGLCPVAPPPMAAPGYLRLAVRDPMHSRRAAPRLGVMRGYPRSLHEQPELREHLLHGEPPTPGASELQASLFTLPTHARVSPRDVARLQQWIATGAVAPS